MPIIIPYAEIESARQNINDYLNEQNAIINGFNALQQQYTYPIAYPMDAIARINYHAIEQSEYVIELLNETIHNINIDPTLNFREKICGFIVASGLLISWQLDHQIRSGTIFVDPNIQELQGILDDYNTVQLQEVISDDAKYSSYFERFVILTVRTNNTWLLALAIQNGARLYDSQTISRTLRFNLNNPQMQEAVRLLHILTTKPVEQKKKAAVQADAPSEAVKKVQEDAPREEEEEAAATQEDVKEDAPREEEEETAAQEDVRNTKPQQKSKPQVKLSPAEYLKIIQTKSSKTRDIRKAWNALLELSDLEFYTLELDHDLSPLQSMSGHIKKHDENIHRRVTAKRSSGYREYLILHPKPTVVTTSEQSPGLSATEQVPADQVQTFSTPQLSDIEKLKLDISSGNYDQVQVLAEANKEEPDFRTTLETELLAHLKLKRTPGFPLLQLLSRLRLSIDFCQKLLSTTNLPPEIRDATIVKLCDLQQCSERDFLILHRRFNLLSKAANISVVAKVKERVTTNKVWAFAEAQRILPDIFNKEILDEQHKESLTIFANQKNSDAQTPLMLAFKHNNEVKAVSEATFHTLLDASDNTLIDPNANGDSILFYAARYFDPKLSGKLLRKLLDKCIAISVSAGLKKPGHILPCMLDSVGNTFLHAYFLRDDIDGGTLHGLKAWESAASNLPEKDDFVRALVLVPNRNNETVLDILDNKHTDLTKTVEYVYQFVPTAVYKFFANIQRKTFALNTTVIPHLFTTHQISRLIKTLERRFILRQAVKDALEQIPFQQRKLFAKVPDLFGENELLSLRLGNDLLFDLLTTHVLNHAEYRDQLLASKAYQETQSKYLASSLEVKVLKKHAADGSSKPLPRYIVAAITKAIAAINADEKQQPKFDIFFDSLNTLKLIHEQCEIPVSYIELFRALIKLDFACNQEDAAKMQYLFAQYRKKEPITSQLVYSVYLSLIAEAHDPKKIEWMANNELDPGVVNEDFTPLHFLLQEGVPEDFKFVLAATKAILTNERSRKKLLEFRDENGNGCLELASTKLVKISETDLHELFAVLLSNGADLNSMRSKSDLKNALHWVAFTCSPKLIYLFAQYLTKQQFLTMLAIKLSAQRHNVNMQNINICDYLLTMIPKDPKLIVSHSDFKEIEKLLSDPEIPGDKIVSEVLEDCSTKVDSLLAKLKAEPGNIEAREQLKPLVAVPMMHGKTVLMLCLELDLPLEVMNFVLEHSRHSIHKWNHNQELILHVWARHYIPARLPLFNKIVECSVQHAHSLNPTQVMFTLTHTNTNNDTFLHVLADRIQVESHLMSALQQIFTKDTLQHFSRLVLFKNSAFKTPVYIVESKSEEWSSTMEIMYDLTYWAITNMPDLSVSECEGLPKQENIMFHDRNATAFKQMLAKKDLYRLLATVDRNFRLQTKIATAMPSSELLPFFDAHRTFELTVDRKSLFTHVSDCLFSTDDDLLRDMWMQSECYIMARNHATIPQCFEYRLIMAALEKGAIPDPRYAASLIKYADTELQQSALDEILLELVPLNINLAVEFVQYILRNIDPEQRTRLVMNRDINQVACFELTISLIVKYKQAMHNDKDFPAFMKRAYDLLNIWLLNGAQPAVLGFVSTRNILYFIALIQDIAISELILRSLSAENISKMLAAKCTTDGSTVRDVVEQMYVDEGEMSEAFYLYFTQEVCRESKAPDTGAGASVSMESSSTQQPRM